MELLTEVERIKTVMGLITENKKKLTRDSKFFWIAERMGDWIFNEVVMDFKKVEFIPFYEKYKQYLILKTKVNTSRLDFIVQSLPEYYNDFLNVMDPQKSEDVIDEFKKHYPNIKQKIDSYDKKESNPNERRGRKKLGKQPKITSAIKSGRFSGDISKLKPLSSVTTTPEVQPETKPQDTPNKVKGNRGRPKVESPFTAQERSLFKKQGVEYIDHLENKFKEYDNLANIYIKRAQEKLDDINRRKQFFGIDQENINEGRRILINTYRRYL
jgi:hypothetical protein